MHSRLLGCIMPFSFVGGGISHTIIFMLRYSGHGSGAVLALGAPLLLPSLLDKAPRQGDIQEFAAARRIANAICWVFFYPNQNSQNNGQKHTKIVITKFGFDVF